MRRALGPVLAVVLAVLPAVGLAPFPAPAARAENLVAAVSSEKVNISSNFTGTEITVFGAIGRDASTISRDGPYDVAVVVTGPRKTFVTREKRRLLGIWVNRDSRTYVDVPSFYSVATTRAFDEIAVPQLLKRFQIGLSAILLPETVVGGVEVLAGHEKFRDAFLRLKESSGLYRAHVGSVRFMTEYVWRVTLPIPANVPVGTYQVEVFLFRDEALLAEAKTGFEIAKIGFEQAMTSLAFERPWAYGVGAVLLAVLTGWLAGVIFRRD